MLIVYMPCSLIACLPNSRHLSAALRRAALILSLATPAIAEETQNWSAHAFGIKVGELNVHMQEDTRTYTGSATFQTTGLAGVLARIRFDIKTSGTREQLIYAPHTYSGDIDTGRRQSRTAVDFSRPLPRKTKGDQTPASPIPDKALKGAIDPLTMLWLTLKDRPAETLCTLKQRQFDGTRLVEITLTTRETRKSRVICSGTYHRLGGYSAEELREMPVTPLSVIYEPHGALWRPTKLGLRSHHGPATLVRRD